MKLIIKLLIKNSLKIAVFGTYRSNAAFVLLVKLKLLPLSLSLNYCCAKERRLLV